MSDRALTASVALVLLVLVYSLAFQQPNETGATRPLSDEAGVNGYLGLRRWLESQQVPVVGHRDRFTALAKAVAGRANSGNVMITTMPQRFRVRLDEVEPLLGWVRRGNTLLVMAALDDTPEWGYEGAFIYFLADLPRITGLRAYVSGESAEAEVENEDGADPPAVARSTSLRARGGELELAANPGHPLMRGIAAMETSSFYPSEIWGVEADEGELLLRLANEVRSGAAAIWQKLEGDGQIIVAGSSTLLTNASIGRADNRRFIANLIEFHLGRGGVVLFDDMHQGRSELYDAQAFFADPRLHRTIGFLIAFWLVWVVGSSNRIVAPGSEVAEPRQRDYLEAVGGFMARRLAPADAGRLMVERWFNEFRRRHGRPESERPQWDELRAVPTLEDELVNEIEAAYARLKRGDPVDLVALHNILGLSRRAMG